MRGGFVLLSCQDLTHQLAGNQSLAFFQPKSLFTFARIQSMNKKVRHELILLTGNKGRDRITGFGSEHDGDGQ